MNKKLVKKCANQLFKSRNLSVFYHKHNFFYLDVEKNSRDLDHVFLHNLEKGVVFSFLIASVAPRVSSVELSVVFSVEKMSVEKI